jgi:hypothetical protein
MTKINEILTLDLQEDIKSVIDLEDCSELEIQQEIESYIVTEGLGQHLYSFVNQFTSNIKETGVWLSGFYGSGKSYFGKMLGYIIGNPIINGTPARERFMLRLKGVSDESLIENSIRNLDAINSRVVFLDVAKQNTDRGLAFTLFANLLKNLGFRDDLYGYMEFDLFIDGKFDEFKNIARKIEGKDWDVLKTSNRLVATVMHKVFSEMGYSEADYSDTKLVYSSAIEDFSASKLKLELEKYLKHKPDETLVFVFDEASEAISQKKFTLLDLEGISEALSSISNKVWTIAIAQEKLDDVINNANVNRSQLTKVTDRFKTKVHLEATEVDVIIRSRLLRKNESGYQRLIDFHKTNEGLVSDATNLKSAFPTKTANGDEFATYYPFHRYQFDILQKFLFSSNALVATQIAARGMIITTFDILRKHLQDKELYDFTPGYSICTEAQTAPPIGLVNKYDTARKVLNERGSNVNGEKLLKTIHLLADSDVVFPTVENITKSYISDIKTYYELKPVIQEGLDLLLEAKVLLLSNNNYKITSDLEGKLLEEMKDFDVELFSKKRSLINCIKDYKIFSPVATFNDGIDSFKFSVLSDQDDELTGSGNKQLKLTVYNLFNISENRQDFIEQKKLETQYQKDLITVIPDNKHFSQIDKLIGEISRYSYVEEKYSNESDPVKRQIIRDFSIMREEKEKEIRTQVEHAYKNASLVYMFDEDLLNVDSFKGTITEIQRKVVKNIYTKRLGSQLSEALVPKIFSSRKDSLGALFSGDDFKFFDNHGNFIGDHLKVVEEITTIIKNRYVDGKTLESDLSGAPWAYSFGTIVSTLAALFRAGRISVKYNGDTWLSYESKGVQEAFTNATKFKSASFKSITATLTAAQKNQAVQLLMDLEFGLHTGKKVDWNTNDFDLADSIRFMAEHFIGALTTLHDTIEQFELLFPTVADQKQILLPYAGKITESNYIEKVEYLLSNSSQFSTSVQTILKAQKFIKKNFSDVKDFKRFTEQVLSELKKADRSDSSIEAAAEEFKLLYSQDMVKSFGSLQQQVQVVKDGYYKLMKNAEAGMSHAYQLLEGKVDTVTRQLKQNYPAVLNTQNQRKLDDLKRYCTDRIKVDLNMEYSISCKISGYSLSDILNYTALAPAKENELIIIQTSFITHEPTPEPDTDGANEPATSEKPRKVRLLILNKIMTVQKYKSLLTAQLTSLASAKADEEIELEIDTV